MNEVTEFLITEDDLQDFKRLDTFLSNKLPEISRSLLKKFYLEGGITSDEKIELKKMPKAGTIIKVQIPEMNESDIPAQNIPLEILFEDEYLIIINKQAGIVVHPAPGNYDGTLVNAILYHCPDLKGIGNEKRPGIVHRLDKGTSGIMVIAKEQKAHTGLVQLFSNHDITRKYEAITLGTRMESEKTITSIIGRSPHNRLKMSIDAKNGKDAVTHMKVINFYNKLSHIELKLETGRTHQIRVHLSQVLNNPILNDPLYGRGNEEKHYLNSRLKGILKNYEHPLLHAKTLGLVHPITGEKLLFNSPPPRKFQEVLDELNNENPL